jgi:uncharacterized protein YkwD
MYQTVIAAPGWRARVIALLTTALVAVAMIQGSPAQAQLTTKEHRLANKIQIARENHGENRLNINQRLSQLARKHSRDMHDAGNPTMHSTTSQLLNYMDEANCVAMIGENVGRATSVVEMHQAFMDSPGHRENILEDNWTKLGVGIRTFNGSLWVTELFCV